MKASELVEVINARIQEHGDRDVNLYVQTGPDSFEFQPVKDVSLYRVQKRLKRSQLELVIET